MTLLERIRRRRTAEQPQDQPTDVLPTVPAEQDAPPGALRRFGRWASSGEVENDDGDEAPTGDEPAIDPSATAVAAAEPEAVREPPAPVAPKGPTSRDRGRLRRRLRYLRRARELGFRDLGGLVFDQYRFRQSNPDLLAGKLSALHVVDSELRALEHILGDRRAFTDLREPGISVCPYCATLHSSDARYCEMCGRPQTGAPDPPDGTSRPAA